MDFMSERRNNTYNLRNFQEFIKIYLGIQFNYIQYNQKKCHEEQCTEDYTEEKGRRLIERVKDHSGKDWKSHLFKHLVETNHKTVTLDDFKIIGKGYRRSKFRRKLAESLHIKEKRSSLNTQEASVPLKLFN